MTAIGTLGGVSLFPIVKSMLVSNLACNVFDIKPLVTSRKAIACKSIDFSINTASIRDFHVVVTMPVVKNSTFTYSFIDSVVANTRHLCSVQIHSPAFIQQSR